MAEEAKEELSLMERLANVQQALQVPKDQYNEFGHYKYRSAESILSAVKPLLKENGLALVLSDDLVQLGDRYYVKATAELIDIKDHHSFEVYAWAREEESKKGMDGSQVTGASSSYARKYALNGMFAIDDVPDSDATNRGEENGQRQQTQAARPADATEVRKRVRK